MITTQFHRIANVEELTESPEALSLRGQYPAEVSAFNAVDVHRFNTGPADGSIYVYIHSVQGFGGIMFRGRRYEVTEGMYVAAPSYLELRGCTGFAVMVKHRSMFHLGGPIESTGRLAYIDGCSDTLLIGPHEKGDPCLNHLHFPPGISQTPHTHPSFRAGMVVKGRGECRTPAGRTPLVPGTVFVIPEGGIHSFFTDDSSMDVIAFHPDTDTGPTHEDHPMINRTIVDGVSASQLGDIRTNPDSLLR